MSLTDAKNDKSKSRITQIVCIGIPDRRTVLRYWRHASMHWTVSGVAPSDRQTDRRCLQEAASERCRGAEACKQWQTITLRKSSG